MEELNLKEEKTNSITLKKDSKGSYNWDIKLYYSKDYKEVLEEIKKIDGELRSTFNKED